MVRLEHTEDLEDKVRQRTQALEQANREMAAAQKKIGDSIDYASLIQRAILPDRQLQTSLGEHHFVLWKPRDVVGGTQVGVLDEDLRKACLAALGISRVACRQFALSRTWERSHHRPACSIVEAIRT